MPNFNLGSPHLEMSSCQNAKTGLFLEVSTVEQLKRVFKSGARNTPKYVTTERSPQISTSFLPLLHFLISPSVRLSSCVIIVSQTCSLLLVIFHTSYFPVFASAVQQSGTLFPQTRLRVINHVSVRINTNINVYWYQYLTLPVWTCILRTGLCPLWLNKPAA